LGLGLGEKQKIHVGTEDMLEIKNEKNRKCISFFEAKRNKRGKKLK
jgi:hypothetical protein